MMELLDIHLDSSDKLIETSGIIPVIKSKKYILSTDVQGIGGEPFCGYFGIDIIYPNKRFSQRRINWLNDFSGKLKHINLVFTAPTDEIKIIYHINHETRNNSKCHYKLLPLEEVAITEEKNFEGHIPEDSEIYFARRFPELTPEQELMVEKNLVWILASTRSGTTWLATQLLTFETNHINEPNLSKYLGFAAPEFSDDLTDMDYFKHRPGYFFSEWYKETWIYFLRKLILNRAYAECPDFSKKIIIQEPGGLGHYVLAQCLKNSKIIVIHRDGRDIVDSTLDARINLPPGGRFTKLMKKPLPADKRSMFIKNRSIFWVRQMENLKRAYENQPKDLRLRIKYEDLRKSTTDELEKIYKFIGINISKPEVEKIVERYRFENIPSKQRGKGKFFRSGSSGNWKENFSEEEKVMMEDIMGSTLKQLGY